MWNAINLCCVCLNQAKEGKADLPPEMAHVKDVDELVEHADGFAEVRACLGHKTPS